MASRSSVYGSRARVQCLAVVCLVPLFGACASSGGDGPPVEQRSDDGVAATSDNGTTTTPETTSGGAPASNSESVEPSTTSPHQSSAGEGAASSAPPNTTPPDEVSSDEIPPPDASENPPPPTPSGDPASSGSDPEPPNSTAPMPRIPAISGTCPTFETGTVTVAGLGGISLQVGPKKDGTGSLVFYWHGTGSSASEVNTFLPRAVREEILDAGGIIVSFDDSTGTGGDCSGTSTFSKDDFEIADLIAACAVRDHAVDPRRIYTTGCSAGGLQAGCMGAMRSSYIAAVAPNSGGEVSRQSIEDPSHTPAVMTMHGGSSDVVVVAFSRTSATYDAHMKEAGSFVVNCDHGGGHCRAPSELYSAAWEFMKAHPFGVEPSPFEDGLPDTFPDYCQIY